MKEREIQFKCLTHHKRYRQLFIAYRFAIYYTIEKLPIQLQLQLCITTTKTYLELLIFYLVCFVISL